MSTASFDHISSATLVRVANSLTGWSKPLRYHEVRIRDRALRMADQDSDDAAAILLVASDR